MHYRSLPLFFILLSLLSSCSFQSLPTPEAPPTSISTEAPPAPALTLEVLQNATYTLVGFSDEPMSITLVNGSYQSGPDSSVIGYTSVGMVDMLAFGDLNGDSVPDAAVVLGVNTGGTGVFTFIAAVINDDGVPVHAASALIDDRPQIMDLSITSGEILAQTTIHRADDPMCCPSFSVEQGYRLYNEQQLVPTRWAGQTADGQLRAINITAPVDLAELAYPFTVNGNVTIGPFENTLAYKIYTPDNTLVTTGSLMTDSPDAGQPGNFSLPVDLALAGVTGLIRIEFIEYSMADGAVMTLDSLVVLVP